MYHVVQPARKIGQSGNPGKQALARSRSNHSMNLQSDIAFQMEDSPIIKLTRKRKRGNYIESEGSETDTTGRSTSSSNSHRALQARHVMSPSVSPGKSTPSTNSHRVPQARHVTSPSVSLGISQELAITTRDEVLSVPHSSTPCKQYDNSRYNTLWCKKPGENVITFHKAVDSPWDSSKENSSFLDTSTTGYKRGKYPFDPDTDIKEQIVCEGMHYHLPKWLHKAHPPSVHMLADHHLGDCPIGDRYCKIMYCQHLPISQWLCQIRDRTLLLKEHTIILYL